MRDFDMSMKNGAMGDEDDSRYIISTDEDGKLPEFCAPPTLNEYFKEVYKSQVEDIYKGLCIRVSDVISHHETSCNHSWKTYTGLNTMFEYCEVCDAKKNERRG